MDVIGYSRDRKGIAGYDFSVPEYKNKKDLSCYNCSFVIKDVAYFDEMNSDVCERRKEIIQLKEKKLFCRVCQRTELEISREKLYEEKEKYICHSCLFEEMQRTSKNPSDENKKYVLSYKDLK
jgi:predicted Fe-S protein YdhL (DUF1289 family)